tara:strand:- start:852 stop:1013 length:162 start_codon:yes stop_codon:yes gene_type:complete
MIKDKIFSCNKFNHYKSFKRFIFGVQLKEKELILQYTKTFNSITQNTAFGSFF